MAVSNLLPRKAKGNRTRSQTLQARFAYDETEEKTGARCQQFSEKGAAKRGASFKEQLRNDIDNALSGCKNFEEFLARMRAEGYEVRRRGKSLEFKAQGQERYRRSYRLGEDYSEEAPRGIFKDTGDLQRIQEVA